MPVHASMSPKDIRTRYISDRKIANFFSDYPTRRIEKHRILIFPEDDIDVAYYVLDGVVRVYDITRHGNEIVVSTYMPSSIFPLSAILNKTHNNYFFEASTDLRVAVAPREEFINFIKQEKTVLYDMLANSYVNSQNLRRRMAHLMGGTAERRLAYELLMQGQLFGKSKAEDSYTIKMHESELGARAGLSRETVSRELHLLKDEGLVNVQDGEVIINSRRRLEEFLGTAL